MKNIEIAGKEYPFIISAAAAKRYFSSKEDSKDPMMIDASIDLIYNGVKDANMRNGFIKRVFWYAYVPSRKVIAHTIDMTQIKEVMSSLFPKEKPKKGKV